MTNKMSDVVQIIVPGIPIAQPRHRIGKDVKGNARAFEADRKHAIHAFKATVALAAKEKYTGPPMDGPILCALTFVLPRPKSMMWKKKPMPRWPHTKKPDSDNLAKGVIDALGGILWRDDAQLFSLQIDKWIASADEQPRCIICAGEVELS